MTRIGLLFPFIFMLGCSSVKFSSSSIIPISFEENENHFLEVKLRVEKSFYLWGLMPEKSNVEVDKLFEEKGIESVSSLEVVEVETKTKVLWMLLTLGLYYPQTFEFKAKATQ